MTNGDKQQGESRASLWKSIWWFIEILNVRLRFIFLMVLVGFLVGYWETIMNYYDRWRRPDHAPDVVSVADIEFYCPMHPNIIRSEPGSCPICGMPLAKRAKTGQTALPEGVLARQQLTPLKMQMGRIGTTPIDYRLLAREIRTVGIVDYDETKRAFIASRIKGRADKLMVNFVGQYVRQGDPLLLIYSPELLSAQQELLVTVRQSGASNKTDSLGQATNQSLIESSRQKLLLWGITEEQIEQIIKRGTPFTHLTIYAPISGFVTEKKVLEGHYIMEGEDLYTIADLSNVWLQAKVHEDEVAGVAVGTAVEVTSTAYPGEVFAGRVTFLAYMVDTATRTVSARVEIANPDFKLKPGMYAHAVIRIPVGRVTEIEKSDDGSPSPPLSGTDVADTGPLAKAYLTLTAAYAADKTDDTAAAELQKQAKTIADSFHGLTHDRTTKVSELAQQLNGKDLAAQRGLLKSISAEVIALLRAAPPSGMNLRVFQCPMVQAEWLQEEEGVVNPYMGTEMLRCGEPVGTVSPSTVRDSEQFATGYYCPIYPDRLFDRPEICPIDKFPLRLARVEKSLAIPASAVINTGTRRIVYRESEPGTFDMLEIQVGKRAGEFYPVLSGLKSGDRVATAGAFLVDAENRLNPAASAQYFGASGGPQESGAGGAHPH